MTKVIEQMMQAYAPETPEDRKNAMKEVMQEIALCGLSRASFFEKAIFYGGTALRIFHGLDRFSEDLDFSLREPDPDFSLQEFLPILEREVQSFGLNMSVQSKQKLGNPDIKTAFMKGDAREHLLQFFPDADLITGTPAGEWVQIKLEIDVNPPLFAGFEHTYRLMPLPYAIALYDKPSLFAGKIHAVLCRAWKNRVKGRDLYDYVYFLSRNIPYNLAHLRERLIRSGVVMNDQNITDDDVKEWLTKKFLSLDYGQARKDVLPFIRNSAVLDMWSAEFFTHITQNLRPS